MSEWQTRLNLAVFSLQVWLVLRTSSKGQFSFLQCPRGVDKFFSAGSSTIVPTTSLVPPSVSTDWITDTRAENISNNCVTAEAVSLFCTQPLPGLTTRKVLATALKCSLTVLQNSSYLPTVQGFPVLSRAISRGTGI